METTITPCVEVDERIRLRPELYSAVSEATEFLENQAEEVEPPAFIRWHLTDANADRIQLVLADSLPSDRRTARGEFWTRWILDPVNRKICVLQVWGKFMSTRVDEIRMRVNKRLIELEEEESDGQ